MWVVNAITYFFVILILLKNISTQISWSNIFSLYLALFLLYSSFNFFINLVFNMFLYLWLRHLYFSILFLGTWRRMHWIFQWAMVWCFSRIFGWFDCRWSLPSIIIRLHHAITHAILIILFHLSHIFPQPYLQLMIIFISFASIYSIHKLLIIIVFDLVANK